MYQWATEGGYDEKEIRNEWYELNPETSEKKSFTSSIEELKAELHENAKALADFDDEKNSALERLKNVEIFDSDSIFNRKTKEKKASFNEWSAAVRDKVSNIISRKNDLLTRHNEILAQIRSLSFVSTNDDLQNFPIPPGYSVSNNGIEKVAGESMISV